MRDVYYPGFNHDEIDRGGKARGLCQHRFRIARRAVAPYDGFEHQRPVTVPEAVYIGKGVAHAALDDGSADSPDSNGFTGSFGITVEIACL